nr:T9SS type A sorting domain-containing protein [Bacteroidota bacterium]
MGLTENNEDELFLYPNPASKTIFIKSNVENQTGLINIYNSSGILMMQDKLIDSELELNIERIESGLYLVEIDSGGRKQYLKFMKK